MDFETVLTVSFFFLGGGGYPIYVVIINTRQTQWELAVIGN